MHSGLTPFEAAIVRKTDELLSEFSRQSEIIDANEMKPVLRSLIDKLEDMYSRM